MAPPRKHETDAILDAARTLVLSDGPRAASVAAIATASGAPAGTLYHRFGSRNGVLSSVWLRAIERFQQRVQAAGTETAAVEAAVAMTRAAVEFAREHPEDARLLLQVRLRDLFDGATDTDFLDRLDRMNAPSKQRLRRIAADLFGQAGGRELDTVVRAVVDIPYAALCRHAPTLPDWLDEDLATATRSLLQSHHSSGTAADDRTQEDQ